MLIILALITIDATIGDNGLLKKAQEAGDYMKNAEASDLEMLENVGTAIDENKPNATQKGIWKVEKSTEEYAGYIELYVKSTYFKEKPMSLNEYKEKYVVKTMNEIMEMEGEEGYPIENLDEELLWDDYRKGYIKTIEEKNYIYGDNLTRAETLADYFYIDITDPEKYADDLLKEVGYTEENIQEIEAEYNEYEQAIDEKYSSSIPEEIREKTYKITYPDGTEETVEGKDLYKYEGSYLVEERTGNIIKVAEGTDIKEFDIKVDNFAKRYKQGEYSYIPLRGGYSVEVIDNTELTSYTGEILDYIDNIPVNKMYYTFGYCENATEIDIGDFDTSKVTDMAGMFYGCNSLTELDVSGFNTSKVIDMAEMFNECNSLTELDVSGFDTSNVTNMAGMFYGCNSLTELDVSSFDTSNVYDMSYMFSFCFNLTRLDVNNFKTSKVYDMSNMFNQCYGLTEINVSNFDTSNVYDMSNMFAMTERPTKLQHIYGLENFKTSNVRDMSAMFQDCRQLTELNLSSFDTSNVYDMSFMFSWCEELTELDLSNFNTTNAEDMSSMFRHCTNLKTIYVGDGWNIDNADTYYMFDDCGTSEVTKK